ncbi:MAG: hypothetical protein SVM86_03415 [Candidatus Cloacimonadota bacterium]|nr:hypothetical protein [Candidatus Cloacimonadota bacterium]
MKFRYVFIVFIVLLTACAQQSDPFEPSRVLQVESYYPTRGFARDFSINDSLLFIAADQAGFTVYNHLTKTKLCNYYQTFENARLIHAVNRDSLLFIYDRYGEYAGIRIFDITEPSQPQEEMLLTGRSVDAMHCIPKNNGTIEVITASSNKLKYGEYDGVFWYSYSIIYENAIEGFDIDDEYFYVCGEQIGVYITSRESGELLTIYDTPGNALAVKKVDNHLFVANKQEGFSVIDISNLQNPEELFWQDTSGYAQDLDLYANFLAIGSGGGGVYLYDISNLADVKLLDRIEEREIGYVYRVQFFDGDLFAATQEGVYKLSIDR